jgi:hypothetical protein
MAQLGVFLIPEPAHPFYEVASGILGYDIWERRRFRSSLTEHLNAATLQPWLGRAPTFGVHCTITGGDIIYDHADRQEILDRLGWIASRTAPFTLENGRFFDDFHANPCALVTAFDSPDGAIDRLHRQVATIVSPLHVDSRCQPPRDPDDARGWQLYHRFGEAWALERFSPHWSLMTGLPDAAAWSGAREVISERTELFADERTRTLPITDIHLVESGEDGYCAVAASFSLAGLA